MAAETVLVAECNHETNTFSGVPTDRRVFRERREHLGDDVVEALAGTNTEVGGVIDVAREAGVSLVHPVSAAAMPGGRVTEAAYEFYTNAILDAVEAHREELDGVLLALHGAMVPEGRDDGEGPLVAAVRDLVGESTPMVVTLDLHGNVSDELAAEADALVSYESYPHVDMGETGRTGMDLLLRMVRDGLSTATHVERPPVLAFTPRQNTRAGPMADVMAEARALEGSDGVLKVNVLPGFHQADVPQAGFSVPVVAETADAARDAARAIAGLVWERREEFVADYPGPAEAVAEATRLVAAREAGDGEGEDRQADGSDGPVVLADTGDNPGGGSPADGTTVLRELLDRGVENAGFAILCDPAAVAACVEAGVGERVTVTLGGKTDDLHGDPIVDCEGYVKAITDGRFVNAGAMEAGVENRLGRAVRLDCGRNDGVSVLVTERRLQPWDAEVFRHLTVQPERLDVLVVKSSNHYRAEFEPMASHVIPVDSPGFSAMDPGTFEYRRLDGPRFPIDDLPDDAYPDRA